MSQKISTSDLAEVLGISPRTVTKLVDKKVLVRNGYGSFDLHSAVQSYVSHREAIVAAEHGQGGYGRARTALYQERARMARIQRQEIEGEMIPTKEVIAMNTAIAATVRTRMLSVGPKVAPRLVGLKSAGEAEAIISSEITKSLEEISRLEIVLAGDGPLPTPRRSRSRRPRAAVRSNPAWCGNRRSG